MGCLAGLGWFIVLLAVVNLEAPNKSSTKIHSKCLGNLLRVDVSQLGGSFLEVSAVINNSSYILKPSLSSQCGFTLKKDHLGNVVIYASIQNCFAQNVDDKAFTTTLVLRIQSNNMVEDELYRVEETCYYSPWASREIVCKPNYMEVSVKKAAPNGPGRAPEPMDAGFRITAVVFFSPEQRVMKVDEAQKNGYWISSTPNRLVLRSPNPSRETYTQDVAGVPMTVLNTLALFEKTMLTTRLYAGAACPQPQGGVFFTETSIRWFLPRRIDPLISSKQFRLLEVTMGVDGRRLESKKISARKYSLTLDDLYVIVEIPIGAAGGQIKSHVQNGQHFTSYKIELMLELLWTDDDTNEDTRYKVILPVETPLKPQPPQVIDTTVPKELVFKAVIKPLGFDVMLMDFSFPSEVLSCIARGFKVFDQMSPNGNSKGYTPPSISGSCDDKNFHVLVKYANKELNFETIIGKQLLTGGLARQYGFMGNNTHFSLTVPFSAPGAMLEAVEKSSIRSRLDVTLRNMKTNKNVQDFSLACNFVTKMIECFPNGTITAMAITLESVPSLNPRQLTLRNPACGPTYSNDQYAYFVFTANSCGTTRKFLPNMMLYENEISIPDEGESRRLSQSQEPEFELKVSCYYDIYVNHAVLVNTRPRRSEPYADDASGRLQVEMRVAMDDSYSVFHRVEEDRITKYLQQPLYFEVELMESYNPEVSLELAYCWATLEEDKMSLPRWDLIINGCANPRDPHPVIFHSVLPEGRVHYPSNFKRFEVPMFAFDKDMDNLNRQVFVHCDVVICDVRNPVHRACNVQCSSQDNRMKGQKRAVSDDPAFKHVSSGPIIMSS